ncbi:hypothetical protein ACRAWD_09360 [Caulobacter segnis]
MTYNTLYEAVRRRRRREVQGYIAEALQEERQARMGDGVQGEQHNRDPTPAEIANYVARLHRTRSHRTSERPERPACWPSRKKPSPAANPA